MTRLVLGFVLSAILVMGIFLYGHSQYGKGYHERDAKAQIEAALLLEEARKKEHLVLLELEEAYHDAYEQKKVAAARMASLVSDRDRLRATIATQSQRDTLSLAPTGVDAVSTACWIALDESVSRYTEVAGDADGYVEDLRKGQGWAKAITLQP